MSALGQKQTYAVHSSMSAWGQELKSHRHCGNLFQNHMQWECDKLRGSTMAHYLVSASPKTDRLDELRARLTRNEFHELQPFGRALTKSLRDARIREDGLAVWEEEDYCRPPLAEERAAVLDTYFDDL